MNSQIIKRAAMVDKFFRAIDILIIILAGALSYFLKFGDLQPPSNYLLFILVLVIISTNTFSIFSIYNAWRGKRLTSELTKVSLAWVAVILTISTLTFITHTGHEFSRVWAGNTFVIAYFGFILYRICARLMIRKLLSKGFNQKHVAIIGAGELGIRACKAMQEENWAGLVPVAFFDDNPKFINTSQCRVPIKGNLNQAISYIEDQRKLGKLTIDQVWIALPLTAEGVIKKLQLALLDTATKVYFVPDIYGFNLASYKVREVVGLPVMNMSAPTINTLTASLKRTEDIIISFSLLILLSPVLIICALLIKKNSPGPIIFKQKRYGMNGKEILVWKFRSMTVTEEGNAVKQASRNDSRVTKIGKVLRKTSLDELPQLVNVLQGKMSLIGPRPHASSHNEFYRKKIKGYMVRHQIKPGITGWAQVNGSRGETAEIKEMEDRIRLDLEYIRNYSIFLDIKIAILTFKTLFDTKNTY